MHSAVPNVFSTVPLATRSTTAVFSKMMPLAWLTSIAVTFAPVSGRIFMSNGLVPGCMKERLIVMVSKCSGSGYLYANFPVVFDTLPLKLATMLDIVAVIVLMFACESRLSSWSDLVK